MISGDRARALRAAYEVNLSPAAAADPELWERYQAIAAERAVAVQVIMAQAAACAQHDTHERLPGVTRPDARDPRVRGRDDPGRERRA